MSSRTEIVGAGGTSFLRLFYRSFLSFLTILDSALVLSHQAWSSLNFPILCDQEDGPLGERRGPTVFSQRGCRGNNFRDGFQLASRALAVR